MLDKWEKLSNNTVVDIDDGMMHSALEIVCELL